MTLRKDWPVPEVADTQKTGHDVRARLDIRNKHAFAEAERRGLMLAARVRTIALVFILVWVIVDNTDSGLIYFYNIAEVGSFATLGILQYLSARQRFHMNVLKYVFVAIDCALLAFVLSSPGPFETAALPPAVALDGSRAAYFFVFLLQAAFSLRPALVLWCGLCIVAARAGMLLWFTSQPDVFTNLDLTEQSAAAFYAARPDANFIYLGFWATDILVTLILAAGLAVVVRRSRRLVESRSIAERTRASLARYFSPNVRGPSQHIQPAAQRRARTRCRGAVRGHYGVHEALRTFTP